MVGEKRVRERRNKWEWEERGLRNRYAGTSVEDGEYWKCVPSTVGIEIERQEMWEKWWLRWQRNKITEEWMQRTRQYVQIERSGSCTRRRIWITISDVLLLAKNPRGKSYYSVYSIGENSGTIMLITYFSLFCQIIGKIIYFVSSLPQVGLFMPVERVESERFQVVCKRE